VVTVSSASNIFELIESIACMALLGVVIWRVTR
jgi:hypothetical protein